MTVKAETKNPCDFAGVERSWTVADELNSPAAETTSFVNNEIEELTECETETTETEEQEVDEE